MKNENAYHYRLIRFVIPLIVLIGCYVCIFCTIASMSCNIIRLCMLLKNNITSLSQENERSCVQSKSKGSCIFLLITFDLNQSRKRARVRHPRAASVDGALAGRERSSVSFPNERSATSPAFSAATPAHEL